MVSCQNNSSEKSTFERIVTLQGQANFRDLGNYKTEAGKSIKPQMIYRSGTLAKLSDKDVQKLKELEVKTVVNFLDEGEIKKAGSNKLPEGVKSVLLHITGQNNEDAAVLEVRQTGDFSKVTVDFNY